VKRRDLVRRLADAGFVLVRTRGPHDVFGRGALRIAVPRHTEIKEHLARKILKEAGVA
jgi:predicted RNA binding protein YcfA (HicA-like mRNA interferase family)